uniref:transmembrane protein 64-like isoform X1 n=1 Tax=Pristiophorus japonicus TaxID=55135 RepID=UPI00398EF8C4
MPDEGAGPGPLTEQAGRGSSGLGPPGRGSGSWSSELGPPGRGSGSWSSELGPPGRGSSELGPPGRGSSELGPPGRGSGNWSSELGPPGRGSGSWSSRLGPCSAPCGLGRQLLLVVLVTVPAGLLVWGARRHLRELLGWLERQELSLGVLLFTLGFALLSLPWSWGYTVLSLAPGYLYGFQRGLAVVVFGVAVGTGLAHLLTKRCLLGHMTALVRGNAKLRAIIRVLDGASGLKVVFLARLTPIPFGLQNAVFAISKLEMLQYLATSTVGLLPSQILNSYLGSTVRSLEDVVNHRGVEGYLAFALQICISVAMMLYFVRRARQELNRTIQTHDANQPEGEALLDSGTDTRSTTRTDLPSDRDLV